MILIKDGRVIDPKSGMDETLDLIIRDGTITEMCIFVIRVSPTKRI